MFNTKKLSAMPYANAYVREYDNGTVQLISYTTMVVEIDSDGWLTCTGTYSQTTRKHISAFMRERVHFPNGDNGSYYLAKEAYERNEKVNIFTGEIADL